MWFLIAIATIITLGCHTTPKGAMPPLSVECVEAQTQNVCDQIWFTTTTEPIRSAIIAPRVDGFLEFKTAKSGTAVSRNEILFTIDADQLTTLYMEAVAAKESAEASLIESRNNYDRAVPMARINAISQTQLDEYRADYAAAQADMASAEQQALNAKINLSYATITSPIDGIVAYSDVVVGDYVGSGTDFTTLTTVNNIDTLQLPLMIPTTIYLKHAKSVDSSDNADLLSNIELILADSSLYPIRATYSYTKQDASQEYSAISIVVNLPNPDLRLKSGMFARMRADIGEPMPRVVVPQKAVTQMQGVSSVWIIDRDSTARMQIVTLGNTHNDLWVVSSGVEAGDRVVTSGQLKLHSGAKVNPTISKI